MENVNKILSHSFCLKMFYDKSQLKITWSSSISAGTSLSTEIGLSSGAEKAVPIVWKRYDSLRRCLLGALMSWWGTAFEHATSSNYYQKIGAGGFCDPPCVFKVHRVTMIIILPVLWSESCIINIHDQRRKGKSSLSCDGAEKSSFRLRRKARANTRKSQASLKSAPCPFQLPLSQAVDYFSSFVVSSLAVFWSPL